MAVFPDNRALWAALHRTDPSSILVAEDRSCASAVKAYGAGRYQLTINGADQNGMPFDDFHVLIGLIPTLAADDPEHGLAVGFGIGSTSHSMLAADRLERVSSVELCGGHYELSGRLARRGVPEHRTLVEDPRHVPLEGDGRRVLLASDERYDVVVPDTVRPNSGGSGNLYSLEFQRLVHDRLAHDGLTAGWLPTFRVLNAVSMTFPYVVVIRVPSYNDSAFYLAGHRPIALDPATLLSRFDGLDDDALPAGQRAELRRFVSEMVPECVNDGSVAPPAAPDLVNTDLRPRDEYFLHSGGIGEEQVTRTCRGPADRS